MLSIPRGVVCCAIFPKLNFRDIINLYEVSWRFNELVKYYRSLLSDKDKLYLFELKKFISDNADINMGYKYYKKIFKLGYDEIYVPLIGTEILRYKDYSLMLSYACLNGNMKVVSLILEIHPDLIEDNYNLIIEACRGGNLEIINLFNINESKHWNWGLYGACRGGHIKITELMIQKGANRWSGALSYACRSGNLEVIQCILKHMSPIDKEAVNWDDKLFYACQGGNMEAVYLMIKLGGSSWNYGFKGACRGNNLEVIKLMIEKGADNIKEGLRNACIKGNIKVIEFLINHIETTPQKKSPWNYGLLGACESDNKKIAKLMIQKGADMCEHCHDMKRHK